MARFSRIPDPMEETWWDPSPDAIRVDFNSTELMMGAGIPPDMSAEADEAYYALVRDLVAQIDADVEIRATGYRYGPAAGDADPAFLDLLRAGLTLAEAAGIAATVVGWLRRMGATEVRISERAAEALATWELSRHGHGTAQEVMSISRTPGREQPAWGGRRQLGDYVAVVRLHDARLATVRLGVDGILREISVPDRRESGNDAHDTT